MSERILLDMRLLDRYAYRKERKAAPSVAKALEGWWDAIVPVDLSALDRFLRARGPAERQKSRAAAEAAFALVPPAAAALARLVDAAEEAGRGAKRGAFGEIAEAGRASLEALGRVPRLREEADAALARYEEHLASMAARLEAWTARSEALARDAEREARSAAPTEAVPRVRGLFRETLALLDERARELELLSRADAVLAAAPFEERRRAAWALLARSFLGCKRRLRETGAAPDPPEERSGADVPEAAARFARALGRGDAAAACELLAPSLREAWTPERLSEALARHADEVARANELDAVPPAGAFRVFRSPVDLAWLRARVPGFPAEIREEDYAGRWGIELVPDEEDQLLTDVGIVQTVFVVVARTGAGSGIAFLEPNPA